MNVYDFDNTIYKGETVLDFYKFYLKKDISLLKYIPLIFSVLLRYKMRRISLEELEKKASIYSEKNIPHIFKFSAKEFWDKHESKIKDFYLKQQRADDVVVSASFSFLLDEICRRLGIRYCLCSEIEPESGKIKRICYRDSKPEIFKENFPNAEIDNFYTDSLNDLPMIMLAKKAYLVKGEKLTEIKKENLKSHRR